LDNLQSLTSSHALDPMDCIMGWLEKSQIFFRFNSTETLYQSQLEKNDYAVISKGVPYSM
jgi:hypothetical protein